MYIITSNNMIPPAICCNKYLLIFQTTNCTCPTGSCSFVVFEKYTRAYLHQIALKIMSLPKLNEGGWPSLDFMVLHELIKLTENQSKLQAMTEYYDIE